VEGSRTIKSAVHQDRSAVYQDRRSPLADDFSPPGVRLPRQPRSRASFERMILAAHDLIAESGLEGATVQNILKRSGVGAGSFYARFDGRDALLTYLAFRFWSDAEEGWASVLSPPRWAAAGPKEIVTQFTRMAVVWTHAHGAILRALLVHAMTHEDDELLDQTAELDNTIADHLIRLLSLHEEEFTHADPENAVRLATLQVFATLRSRFIFAWGDRPDGIEDQYLAGELASIFLRYLGMTPTWPPPPCP
jgi:AcrR family transcriptional regulator